MSGHVIKLHALSVIVLFVLSDWRLYSYGIMHNPVTGAYNEILWYVKRRRRSDKLPCKLCQSFLLLFPTPS